jgi:hypothetical protein
MCSCSIIFLSLHAQYFSVLLFCSSCFFSLGIMAKWQLLGRNPMLLSRVSNVLAFMPTKLTYNYQPCFCEENSLGYLQRHQTFEKHRPCRSPRLHRWSFERRRQAHRDGIRRKRYLLYRLGACSPLNELRAEILSAAKKGGHKPPKVLTIRLDVLDRASVDEAAKQVDKEFG